MFSRLKNLSKVELLLIGAAAIILVASLVLHATYKDIFFSSKVSSEDVIARVVTSSNNTRRRSPESFEFKEIKKDDVLANGDYIFSGEGSQIMVKFQNGPRIMIGEQSLIVLRELDGNPDLKLEQGAISGAFEEGSEIEIMTEKEAVILNGEKDSQFYVSYLNGGGLEIGSFDRNIQLEYNGKKVSLKNQKATIFKSAGIKVKDTGTGEDSAKQPDQASQAPAPDAQPRMPSGLDVGTPNNAGRITLNPPYPQQNHVFIHKKGGQIPIFPKQQCQGSCELKLNVDGKSAVIKKFQRDMVPFIFLTVQPDIEAKIHWEFSDGSEVVSGDFQVRKNNKENFQDAFKRQLPVEIMN
ncbi:MAG: hypothetical protein IT288_00035 [Bdellovibrionales bacterium]|nr:hypothetical protein [Bdellovibrionales bacterium]